MEIFLLWVVIGVVGLFAAGSAGAGSVVVFVLIWAGALIIAAWVMSFQTRRQLDILVAAPIQPTAQLIEQHFHGVGWHRVDGRGQFNFQSRGWGLGSLHMENPVLSIDLEAVDPTRTGVNIWMSSWSSRWGMVSSCDRVLTKRWKLTRKLATLGTVPATA
ncbi:hypothetical protein ACFXHA_26325 [Nocardia sp. NPDC059240]|uniref:hypothetical protein n=1 Tax=Nocardia sp. NPDC059240 TaxID=3346786 RepID=UPI0036AF3D5E